MKENFKEVVRIKPEASRTSSKECYLLGKFKKVRIMSQLMRNILVWLAISGITFVAIQNIYNQSPSQNMNYSEFVFSKQRPDFPSIF